MIYYMSQYFRGLSGNFWEEISPPNSSEINTGPWEISNCNLKEGIGVKSQGFSY